MGNQRNKWLIITALGILLLLAGTTLWRRAMRSYWHGKLGSEDPQQRIQALSGLTGYFGFEELDTVLSALHDADPRVRLQATHCLNIMADGCRHIKEYYPPKAAAAVPALAQALRDSDPEVREAAAKVLKLYEFKPEIAVPALVTALDDPDRNVRKEAAVSLNSTALTLQNKELIKPYIPVLITKLRGKDKNVALFVACTFEHLGPLGRNAVPALTELLKDGQTRAAAARALKRIGEGTDETVKALTAIVQEGDNGDPVDVGSAASALGAIGPSARASVPALIKCLNSGWVGVRASSAWALGRIGEKTAIPALAKTLDDTDPDIRATAAEALRLLRSK